MWNILYVEDNYANARLMQLLLRTQPEFHLNIAVNGQDGVNAAIQNHPNLILLDYQLPDLDGYQVLARLRENPDTRDIPVIIITANPIEAERDCPVVFKGKIHIIGKPFNADSLIQTLKETLHAA